MKLQSLNDLFENSLFRIPDYQRGYAWGEEQLKDFWQDLLWLNNDRGHYTGVLTLEPVRRSIWKYWTQDEWLLDDVGYKAFYVVDGQQRLTTTIILIQAILETLGECDTLNYQLPESIRKKYTLNIAPDGQRKSFIFGYEKDNPSDEFFKTEILGVYSAKNDHKESLYTRNLKFAKDFFNKALTDMDTADVSVIFKKLTRRFLFNVYEISEDIDVFVAFETMNNRGKGLTSLELLKNRLIYLSTLFPDANVHPVMREKVNHAWKTIYEYLGKNPDNSLNEDDFLRNHWIMYYTYSRKKGDDYIRYLLNEKFTARNVTAPDSETERITDAEISDYVQSLQESARHWFYMHNPYYLNSPADDDCNKQLMLRFSHLSFKAFRPLILAALLEYSLSAVNPLLIKAERCIFALFYLSYKRSNTGDSDFYSMARKLLNKAKNKSERDSAIAETCAEIDGWFNTHYRAKNFLNYIQSLYEYNQPGFYKWNGLRYFFYEYEQCLNRQGKQSSFKLSWSELKRTSGDRETIEHIYPQNPQSGDWAEFTGFNLEQTNYLTHSLGNLVPLSRPKNSSLRNDSFNKKVNNGKGVGYYNGSAAENEIGQRQFWDPQAVLERGLNLLDFMEQRWNLILGDKDFKIDLLQLGFLTGRQSPGEKKPSE